VGLLVQTARRRINCQRQHDAVLEVDSIREDGGVGCGDASVEAEGSVFGLFGEEGPGVADDAVTGLESGDGGAEFVHFACDVHSYDGGVVLDHEACVGLRGVDGVDGPGAAADDDL